MIEKDSYRKRVIDTYLQISGAICIEGLKWCGKSWTASYHS